jgi:hypothetical protein
MCKKLNILSINYNLFIILKMGNSKSHSIVNKNPKNMVYDHYITTNNIEEKKMRVDIATYGNYDNGLYKNVSWEMRRFSLSGHSEHWCGYVLYKDNLTVYELELIEEKTHIELTAYIGFDCAHPGDYTVFNTTGIYRDHAYVLNCLHEMIDVLIETKSFNKQIFYTDLLK